MARGAGNVGLDCKIFRGSGSIGMKKHNHHLTPIAKKLRREMTSSERKLWFNFLRRFPVRVLRQKIIGDYVVDFYCAKAKLMIEIDGGYHDEGMQRKSDAVREAALRGAGLDVLRFSNEEVKEDFDGVCQRINAVILEGVKKGEV